MPKNFVLRTLGKFSRDVHSSSHPPDERIFLFFPQKPSAPSELSARRELSATLLPWGFMLGASGSCTDLQTDVLSVIIPGDYKYISSGKLVVFLKVFIALTSLFFLQISVCFCLCIEMKPLDITQGKTMSCSPKHTGPRANTADAGWDSSDTASLLGDTDISNFLMVPSGKMGYDTHLRPQFPSSPQHIWLCISQSRNQEGEMRL